MSTGMPPDKATRGLWTLGGALSLFLVLISCDGGDVAGDASRPAPADESPVPLIIAMPGAAPSAADEGIPEAALAVDRVAAVAAAAVVEEQLSLCAKGIEFLQEGLDGFDGAAGERDVIRSGLDTALNAQEVADPEVCLGALSDPFAVLGYGFAPHPPEPVPCVRGINGAIRMLEGIDDNARAQAQLSLDTAIAAIESGDFHACLIALESALWTLKEAQDAG